MKGFSMGRAVARSMPTVKEKREVRRALDFAHKTKRKKH